MEKKILAHKTNQHYEEPKFSPQKKSHVQKGKKISIRGTNHNHRGDKSLAASKQITVTEGTQIWSVEKSRLQKMNKFEHPRDKSQTIEVVVTTI
jgi:hypothetical protein